MNRNYLGLRRSKNQVCLRQQNVLKRLISFLQLLNFHNFSQIFLDIFFKVMARLQSVPRAMYKVSLSILEMSRPKQFCTSGFFFISVNRMSAAYADFSEWFIGHSGSTYWTKKDSEKAGIFHKIEPYLTFLNIPQLERQGADIQSKVEELEALNRTMRDRDKLKDDAIAHLSDQLIAITARLDSIKKRQ